MAYLGAAYLWVKAAHLIFVIFLMAGLFMIPRFFVYHQECAVGSDEDRKWIDREQLLQRADALGKTGYGQYLFKLAGVDA